MEESDFVLTMCLDGAPQEYEYDAEEQTIDAVGDAMDYKRNHPDVVVTLLVTKRVGEATAVTPEDRPEWAHLSETERAAARHAELTGDWHNRHACD